MALNVMLSLPTLAAGLKHKSFYLLIKGHGAERLHFLPNGLLATGNSKTARRWRLSQCDDSFLLELLGNKWKPVAKLFLDNASQWSGHCYRNDNDVEVKLVPRKTCLIIQQGTGDFRPMLGITSQLHALYCLRHEIDFWSVQAEVQFERPAVWDKIALIRRGLRFPYDHLVWMDADTMIVDVRKSLLEAFAEFTGSIAMCRHPKKWRHLTWHFNAGVIFINNNTQVKRFFKDVWNAGPTYGGWEEQDRIMECMNEYPSLISDLDNRWNCHRLSPAKKPVIRGWHGIKGGRTELMSAELELVNSMLANPHGEEETPS